MVETVTAMLVRFIQTKPSSTCNPFDQQRDCKNPSSTYDTLSSCYKSIQHREWRRPQQRRNHPSDQLPPRTGKTASENTKIMHKSTHRALVCFVIRIMYLESEYAANYEEHQKS
ncbi:hypothetical protein GQ457_07G027370 [Hibiscus cannabinus]